ncbi:MAG: DsrE family protein [Luminiphilus sp.]|nr:DsrE family protein [Luminiphilus sp.]
MIVSILVKDHPDRTTRAIEFAEVALANGFAISQVFFYQAGVQHASSAIANRWEALTEQYGMSLILCSASADRYGEDGNDAFRIGGLGALVEAGIENDKVITFG